MSGLFEKLFGRDDPDSDLQARVDEISRADAQTRAVRRADDPSEPSIWDVSDPDAGFAVHPSESDESNPPTELTIGPILGGLLNWTGLNKVMDLTNAANPWMVQLKELTSSLSSEQKVQAVDAALANLSPETRAELDRRLSGGNPAFGIDARDELVGVLDQPDGMVRLMQRLSPEPSSGTDRDGQLNLMNIVRDPLIRDLARTLMPELYKARGVPDES